LNTTCKNFWRKAATWSLFLPVEEIYPPGYQAPAYDIGLLETLLEGQIPPGHFQGVCQVVDRLLQIIDSGFPYYWARKISSNARS
jgi:pantothenate synthetase